MQSKSYASLAPDQLSNVDPNSSYARIRELVGSGKRVLDVGCGPGNLAVILRAAGNTVTGIDNDHAALVSASRVCERTFAANLDVIELDEVVGDERFDVVVFADVLEHLRNPVGLLASSRRVLSDGGCAIVSIPNVAHGAVRLALLRGRFEYQQLGILDNTHVRFYTRDSVMRLLSEGGFTAVRVDRTTAPVFERSDLVPFVRREDYGAALVADVLRDEDAETLQFVVRAAPVAQAQVVAVLTAEITSLQQAVRTLRAQLAIALDGQAGRAEGEQAYANGARQSAERLAEIEEAYRNALESAEAARGERDAAAAAAERAAAELTGLQHELETAQHALAQRDATIAASARGLADLRARHDAAAVALECTRDELFESQRRADARAGERDAIALRADAAAAEAHENLRATRALVSEVERELTAARDEAAALRAAYGALEAETAAARAQRDESAARARAACDALSVAEETLAQDAPQRRTLRRRATDLENFLAVERTTREHVEEASDRLFAVARDREARVVASDLRRLLGRSAVVEMELRLASWAAGRAPVMAVPPPVMLPPALVLHAVTVGRRTLTVLPQPAGRRARLRAALGRLRRLLPILLLLAVAAASCAHDGPVIADAGPAFVRVGDDPSVYFLPAGSHGYCLVAEPVQMKLFGGFAKVKDYDPGARFDASRHLEGTCRYPDGVYRAGGTTYVLHGEAICRAHARRTAIALPDGANLSVSRRDTGRCRPTG